MQVNSLASALPHPAFLPIIIPVSLSTLAHSLSRYLALIFSALAHEPLRARCAFTHEIYDRVITDALPSTAKYEQMFCRLRSFSVPTSRIHFYRDRGKIHSITTNPDIVKYVLYIAVENSPTGLCLWSDCSPQFTASYFHTQMSFVITLRSHCFSHQIFIK